MCGYADQFAPDPECPVMAAESPLTRLQCITLLKGGAALSAVDDAIEAIRDHRERWGKAAQPEEDALTLEILGGLIALQIRAVEQSVRLGEAMRLRLLNEAEAERLAA